MAGEELPNIGPDRRIDTNIEPLCCPRCGNDNTSVDHIEYEHDHVYKYIVCEECDAKWVEDYGFDSAYMVD